MAARAGRTTSCLTRAVVGPRAQARLWTESRPWAFQASILTNDVDRALHAGRRLDATAVMVNDHTAFRVDWMPFGGRRHSGLGLGGMAYTMEEMTQLKMLVLREGPA